MIVICFVGIVCREMALSCMNLSQAMPQENPIMCHKPWYYCCVSDLCNSLVISRLNLFKVEPAPAEGKREREREKEHSGARVLPTV